MKRHFSLDFGQVLIGIKDLKPQIKLIIIDQKNTNNVFSGVIIEIYSFFIV